MPPRACRFPSLKQTTGKGANTVMLALLPQLLSCGKVARIQANSRIENVRHFPTLS